MKLWILFTAAVYAIAMKPGCPPVPVAPESLVVDDSELPMTDRRVGSPVTVPESQAVHFSELPLTGPILGSKVNSDAPPTKPEDLSKTNILYGAESLESVSSVANPSIETNQNNEDRATGFQPWDPEKDRDTPLPPSYPNRDLGYLCDSWEDDCEGSSGGPNV
jgi:hypothetical protein